MLIKIKSWKDGKTLHTLEADSIKAAIEALVRQGADLGGANLWEADLRGADLGGADLWEADLRGADLGGANLRGADLWDLTCLTDLTDAISIAPLIFDEWAINGFKKAKERFGLYKVSGEERALITLCPGFQGGYCYVLSRREIWWWQWSCPDPQIVPVLWRENDS